MSELDKIKKEIEDQLNKKIFGNLDVLINIFVETFGEEYREIITERLKEVNLLFYIDINALERIVKSDKISLDDKDKYNRILNEIAVNKLTISSDPKIRKKNVLDRRAKTIFHAIGNGQLTEFINDNFLDIIDNERVVDEVNGNKTISLLEFANDDERHHTLIILPFLRTSDKTLIHELIHLIGFNEKIDGIQKSGLVVYDSFKDNKVRMGISDIDEYYVEKKAIEIEKKLQENGISLLPYGNFYDYSSYNNMDGMLEVLVTKFDSLFTKATFTHDKDVLRDILGEELLLKLGREVYENGRGSGYTYLGKYGKSISDEFCDEISKKIDI